MKITVIVAMAAALLASTLPVSAERGTDREDKARRDVRYGLLDEVNAERRWLIVNDLAMSYGPDVRVRDVDGSVVTEVPQLRPGSPLKVTGRRHGAMFQVHHVQVLEALPIVVDEEGVVDR